MVNTFLPFEDYQATARILDNTRLGKQRGEAYQIINALESTDPDPGYINHMATQMWVGYVDALKEYTNVMIKEWVRRGNQNEMILYSLPESPPQRPPWHSDQRVRYSHQARLIQKYREYYEPLFPSLPAEYLAFGYIWPSKHDLTHPDSHKQRLSQIAEPKAVERRCAAKYKSTGKPCKATLRKPGPDQLYCRTHTPKHIRTLLDRKCPAVYATSNKPCRSRMHVYPLDTVYCKLHSKRT